MYAALLLLSFLACFQNVRGTSVSIQKGFNISSSLHIINDTIFPEPDIYEFTFSSKINATINEDGAWLEWGFDIADAKDATVYASIPLLIHSSSISVTTSTTLHPCEYPWLYFPKKTANQTISNNKPEDATQMANEEEAEKDPKFSVTGVVRAHNVSGGFIVGDVLWTWDYRPVTQVKDGTTTFQSGYVLYRIPGDLNRYNLTMELATTDQTLLSDLVSRVIFATGDQCPDSYHTPDSKHNRFVFDLSTNKTLKYSFADKNTTDWWVKIESKTPLQPPPTLSFAINITAIVTPPPPSPTPDDDGKLPTWALTIIIILAVAAFLVLAFFIGLYIRKRRRNKRIDYEPLRMNAQYNGIY